MLQIQTCFKDTKMRELAMRESFDIDRLKYEEEITYLRKSRKGIMFDVNCTFCSIIIC